MTDRGIVVTKVVALVFVPIGIVLLAIAGYTGYRQYTILKTWPSVDAEVTKSEVVQGRDKAARFMRVGSGRGVEEPLRLPGPESPNPMGGTQPA